MGVTGRVDVVVVGADVVEVGRARAAALGVRASAAQPARRSAAAAPAKRPRQATDGERTCTDSA